MPDTTYDTSDHHWHVRSHVQVQPGGILGTPAPAPAQLVPFGLERDEEQAAEELRREQAE